MTHTRVQQDGVGLVLPLGPRVALFFSCLVAICCRYNNFLRAGVFVIVPSSNNATTIVVVVVVEARSSVWSVRGLVVEGGGNRAGTEGVCVGKRATLCLLPFTAQSVHATKDIVANYLTYRATCFGYSYRAADEDRWVPAS